MSFDSYDPSNSQGRPEQDMPARQPDSIVTPVTSLQAPDRRDDLDDDVTGYGEGPATAAARPAGLDIESINFAEIDLFANQGTTRIGIPNSDFHILVKNELDFGEQATLDSISIRGIQRTDLDGMDSNSMVVLDVAKQRLYSLAMYIVGWNFTTRRVLRDGSVKREPVALPRTLEERVKLFRRMGGVVGQALNELIQKHIDQHAQEIKRVEAAEEHSMGLMDQGDDEQNAPPKRTLSGASATR